MDVEDLAGTVETVAMADIDDVTWEMPKRVVRLESSLPRFVAGLVEAVVLLLLSGSCESNSDVQGQITECAAERQRV